MKLVKEYEDRLNEAGTLLKFKVDEWAFFPGTPRTTVGVRLPVCGKDLLLLYEEQTATLLAMPPQDVTTLFVDAVQDLLLCPKKIRGMQHPTRIVGSKGGD